MPKFIKLKDLIHQVRDARTAADERTIVQKESAFIRDSFRSEDNTNRSGNVSKLIYIYLLGYPAHFGQVECLKLIASSKFSSKRIGYLGAMLLLDETQDVHLLMSNCLRNDLKSQSLHCVGLALVTLGVICSPQLSQDLAGEVMNILKTGSVHLRKKAILCAAKMLRKVPELIQDFMPVAKLFLLDKAHSILITGITLIAEMCSTSPDVLQHFKKVVPNVANLLKKLIVNRMIEYDVNGVNDPFLVVQILKLLRLLGKNDSAVSETIYDVLTHVATNIDSEKSIGNSILYETVLTILDVNSESNLRALGVNILGFMLLSNDKNVKYVALNALLYAKEKENSAIQRHRCAVVECLKDQDPFIRKKSLELCFALVNTNNICTIVEDIFMHWENVPEFSLQFSSFIFISAQMYSPSERWYIDTMIKVLSLSGNHVIHDIVGNLVKRIAIEHSLRSYVIHQLWNQLTGDLTLRQPLLQVAVWCIGEFGDLLLNTKETDAENMNVKADDVMALVENVAVNSHITLTTKEFTITTLMKLSDRFPGVADRTLRFLEGFKSNINVELQQRASEFSSLSRNHIYLRSSIFERMPIAEAGEGDHTCETAELINITEDTNSDITTTGMDRSSQTDTELELPPNPSLIDLPNDSEFLKLFETPLTSPLEKYYYLTFQPYEENIPSITAFEKNGLLIKFDFKLSANNPEEFNIEMTTTNSSSFPLMDFELEAAVSKSFELKLFPPSGTFIPPNNSGKVKQIMKVLNLHKNQLKVKLRISYISNGKRFSWVSEVKNIPKEVSTYFK